MLCQVENERLDIMRGRVLSHQMRLKANVLRAVLEVFRDVFLPRRATGSNIN